MYFGSLKRVSLITNAAPTRAAIPIGILMKNAHRHETYVVKYPPRTGPRTAAAPAVAPHMPKATFRDLPVNVVVKIERVEGEAIAAPNPWMTRPTSIWDRLSENPSIIDPTMNVAIPAMKISFLPNSSLSFPQERRNEPKMSA